MTRHLLCMDIPPTMDADVLRVLEASKKKLQQMKYSRKFPSLRKHHLVTLMLQKAKKLEPGDSGGGATSTTDVASSSDVTCGPPNDDDYDPWEPSAALEQRPSALEYGICPTPKRPDNLQD